MSQRRPAVVVANSSKTSDGGPPGERIAMAERAAEPREDLPVGQREAGRRRVRAGPARRRAREFVIMPSFSGHCAAGRATCASAAVSVGWYASWQTTSSASRRPAAKRSASGSDTTGFVATTHTALTRPSCSASVSSVAAIPGRGETPGQVGGQPPQLAHLRAVLGDRHPAIAGQQVRQPARLAAAHGVRLAGERQGPRAGPPEVSGEQAEVVQGAVLERADRGLVRAHRPERHRRASPWRRRGRPRRSPCSRRPSPSAARSGDHSAAAASACSAPSVRSATKVSSTRPSRAITLIIAFSRRGRRPADRQVEVGGRGGLRAPRIDDDQLRALLLPPQDPRPDDRVARRGVRAEQQHAVGLVDVGVARRRAVGTEASPGRPRPRSTCRAASSSPRCSCRRTPSPAC